ncbi:hypothetical protein [Nocardioides sp. W7]|uniref:hypothetical protein n=1 Tax=Nocardioides sp. W7 TaxID=2931390 RepID=UPI001FD53A9B|nr:hypothetical protein [Nocardioides sp. W7]
MRAPKLIASAFLVLTLATACGGEGRPSVDDLSKAFQDSDNVIGSGLEKDQADCVAEAFHDSDISDETLQAIVDNDEDYKGDDGDEDALKEISTESIAECMGAELPDMDDLETPSS